MMISVIIPVYNTGKLINRCVESLCKQTYRNIEIILINDGSTDDSLQIMKKLSKDDKRIVVVDIAHSGVSGARNAGLKVMQGDFVSFVDSDDWLDVQTYEHCINEIRKHSADAVFFEWTEEYSDGTKTIRGNKGKNRTVLTGKEILTEYYKDKIRFRISSGLFNRKIVEGISFDVSLESGEDMLYGFYGICRAKCVVYTDQPCYHRYNRIGSLSNRKGFFIEDFGRATCTDCMLEYIAKNKIEFLQSAYVMCFNYYMIILNKMVYFKAESEYEETYQKIIRRLKELLHAMGSPRKVLPLRLFGCYWIYRINKSLYYVVVKVYYKYVKKELDSKRQR